VLFSSSGINSFFRVFALGGTRLSTENLFRLFSIESAIDRHSQFSPICQRFSMSRCAVCDKDEDLKVCSGCGQVNYCSAEHQKQHWKQHKGDCQPYRVRYLDSMALLGSTDLIT
jgi:MYND finger